MSQHKLTMIRKPPQRRLELSNFCLLIFGNRSLASHYSRYPFGQQIRPVPGAPEQLPTHPTGNSRNKTANGYNPSDPRSENRGSGETPGIAHPTDTRAMKATTYNRMPQCRRSFITALSVPASIAGPQWRKTQQRALPATMGQGSPKSVKRRRKPFNRLMPVE
jgi:hypothetical protein